MPRSRSALFDKAPADGSIEIDARAGFGSASADEWAARIGARSFAMFGRARTWGRGPWRNVEDVEFATLAWVDWFNNRRLLSSIGNVPPVEFEERYYADKTSPATEVGLN